MKWEDLKNLDKSVELVFSDHITDQISGISPSALPKDNHLVFIRDRKFFDLYSDGLRQNGVQRSFMIVECRFWNSLRKDDSFRIDDIKNHLAMIATVKDVNLTMSWFSRPFYDEMIAEFDDVIDGRDDHSALIHPEAKVAPNVFIGKNVTVGAGTVLHSGSVILANSRVGKGSVIYPNVTVYHNVSIGDNCRIHGGSTIGSDGFGYNFDGQKHVKVWHLGGVIIENDVEIGSCTCIDAGTFAPTVIGQGTRIDNGVQIGHNCQLGKHVILCGQAGLSGSCKIGDYSVLAGRAGVGPSIEIGPASQIAGGAMVTKNWPAQSALAGHPARPVREWLKMNAFIQRLINKQKDGEE